MFYLWLAVVVAGVVIGANKHRLLSGFVWTFLLGPIGLVIVICLKDLEKEKKAEEAETLRNYLAQKQLQATREQTEELRRLNAQTDS